MGYRNGKDLLPPALLKLVQQYAEGECLYIPRTHRNQQTSGQPTGRLTQRNAEIRRRYAAGCSVRQLSAEYYLSPQAIYKILSGSRK